MDLEMSSSPILLLTVFSPLLGVFLLTFFRGSEAQQRSIAIASTVLSLILSLLSFSSFKSGSTAFQLGQRLLWIPELGVSMTVGVDGLAIWLLMLTCLLTLLVCVASTSIRERTKGYLITILFLEFGMLGTFVTLDLLAFYVFWELMLIPMYFLIGVWGGKNRIYAALKFFIYTSFGSLLMLAAIAYLEYQYLKLSGGVYSFYLYDLLQVQLSSSEELWLFLAFAIAFLIKVPVFPFHTWLPDAHVEAPTGGSVILAGILLKMGIYGLVRFCIPLFPDATVYAAPYLAILGGIGIVAGALLAWVQTDMKKLVAYSSVSHMGFCVIGIALATPEGFQGALIQLINHGVSTAALFFLVGVLYERKHTREISSYGGLAHKVPAFSFVFMVFMLSSVGLPLTNGFVGEFLILLGCFEGVYAALGGSVAQLLASILYTGVAVSGVILGAVYMLSLYRRLMFGSLHKENEDLEDLTTRETLVFSPLLILVFFIGLYPGYILRDLEGTTNYSLAYIKASQDSHLLSNGENQGNFESKAIHPDRQSVAEGVIDISEVSIDLEQNPSLGEA